MSRSFLLPRRATETRTVEATKQQLIATGALGGVGIDPIDGDVGYRTASAGPREIPELTLEKARAYSVAGYRANPMARAVIDTYTSFCVGDAGLALQASNPDVREVAASFWHDPAHNLAGPLQELLLRDHLLNGESLLELMVGPSSGVVRFSPIDPTRIAGISNRGGNVLWPDRVAVKTPGLDHLELTVAQIDDVTELRTGDAQLWRSFRALVTDTRGWPFMGPIVDWLDSYDQVLSNLVDRTALARYFVWDVTVDGDDDDVRKWVQSRGNLAAPRSGTIEVHNKGVEWAAKNAQSGAGEDTATAKTVLTQVAGGAGLAKTWLADPEDANRATSLTMAEPVRRRVSGVQSLWIGYQTELVRFAVDRAVAAGRLPFLVTVKDESGERQVRPADTVSVTGPEIAAADAKVTAEVLMRLGQSLTHLVKIGALSIDAAKFAARKGWEDYVGIPYKPELDGTGDEDADSSDAIAELVEETRTTNAGARVELVG